LKVNLRIVNYNIKFEKQGEGKTYNNIKSTNTLGIRYPTIQDLREHARYRIPRFAFDYVDGAAGANEVGMARNAQALDLVELVPRYGLENYKPDIEINLFGRLYSAPIAIAPMGMPGMVWPGGEEIFAKASHKARIPFTLSTAAGATIERITELAPETTWFQLYRMPHNNLEMNFDLVKRAKTAGVHVLILTLDVPARTKRPRELRNQLTIPYKPGLHTLIDVLPHPGWILALAKHGHNSFANYKKYTDNKLSGYELAKFARQRSGGTFSWKEVSQLRDVWPGPLVVKGILHPNDAEKAISVGVDGVVVSNHGGRQLEGAPATVDVLPAIVNAIGKEATILFDSGIRSGLDVVRVMALGAKAALSGRAFMYGLGALGAKGADHVVNYYTEEISAAMRQIGVHDIQECSDIMIRHENALKF
jgi:(S)-mandelate dehydrogenase|tara:strand:+ start:1805 stop:3064 length:1260 start_codon:yes stop_codon:yes gene_type:complete